MLVRKLLSNKEEKRCGMKWNIFNKSSEKMNELSNDSVDVIITSIPFNVGLVYGGCPDKRPLKDFISLMKNIIEECSRILKESGTIVIEVADSIVCDGYFVQLAALVQSLCVESGLFLETRHINEIPFEGLYYKPLDEDGNHSNCMQWLVFRGHPTVFQKGEVHHYEYPDNHEDGTSCDHPCPFPDDIIDKLLELSGFKSGDVVLDPFMGTGRLGQTVIKRGGVFWGYEENIKIFEKTKKDFDKI